MQLVGDQIWMDWSLYYPINRNNEWYVTSNTNLKSEEIIQKALGNNLYILLKDKQNKIVLLKLFQFLLKL